MAEKKYDLIMSDLGNVLINFDHRIVVRKILDYTPKDEREVYDLVFDSGITSLYETGKISSAEFFNRLKEMISLKMDYKTFLPMWEDIFFETPLNIEYQGFLRGVKDRYKLVMISNINESHYLYLEKKMPILKEFDKLILSYEVGFRKPAPQIYDAALESVGVSRDRAFYVDDRRDLIESAEKLGIKGVTFDGEEAFQRIQEELGSDFSKRLS
ncbi:MAG: HAD-IA family hydrolase [Candidatus Omnitrophota bacterium]